MYLCKFVLWTYDGTGAYVSRFLGMLRWVVAGGRGSYQLPATVHIQISAISFIFVVMLKF